MADYFTSTVVQHDIPCADMTTLERLVLGLIFEAEQAGDDVYFFARDNIDMVLSLPLAAVRWAMVGAAVPSRLLDLGTGADAETLGLDLSAEDFAFIFQDIVRRSSTLPYVTVEAAFTCSKMRADGFGGMATLITADDVLSESTTDLLEKWLADAFP